jgi:hypothetical protein
MLLKAYPDPSAETTTVDGHSADDTNGTWNNLIRVEPGDESSDNTATISNFLQAHSTTNVWSYNARTFYLFDTSAIGDSDSIGIAKLARVHTSKTDNFDLELNVVASAPASNTAIVNGDYDSVSFTAFATSIDLTSITANSATYTEWTLNTDGKSAISKTGVSKFAIIWEEDRADTEPTWVTNTNGIAVSYTADQTGTTTDPVLLVTYGGVSTTNTSYPDPDTETTTVDGWTQQYNGGSTGPWSTFQGGVGSAGVDNDTNESPIVLQNSGATEWRVMRRGLYLFDTSSITDGDSLVSATLGLMMTGISDAANITSPDADVVITTSAPATNTALVAGDYDSLGTTILGTLDYDTITPSSTIYNQITFSDLTQISKTGVTKLGLRYKCDANNTQPASVQPAGVNTSFVSTDFADQTGTLSDPILIVAHGITLQNLTLTADVQTYTLTGVANTLKVGKLLTADVQTYSLTLLDATLLSGEAITVGTGSFVLTGNDVTLSKNLNLFADTQTYVLTGIASTFNLGLNLLAETGVFLISSVSIFLRTPTVWTKRSKNTSIWNNRNQS